MARFRADTVRRSKITGADTIRYSKTERIIGPLHLGGLVLGLLVALLLIGACMPITAPTPMPPEEPAATPELPTPSPVEEEVLAPTATPEPQPEADSPPEERQPETVDLDAIFPTDEEWGRTMTMMSCSGCHAWVCAVIDQRPVDHWRTTQATHRDLMSGLSDEDYTRLFEFLAEYFNDNQPEPPLPAVLRQQGCSAQ